MSGRLWLWALTLLWAGALEAWGIADPRPNDTLSELTAWTFHTSSATGRWVFIGAWGVFAAWFVVHITTFKLRNRGGPK